MSSTAPGINLFFFDTETSGLHRWNLPCAIMEFAIVSERTRRAYRTLVHPGDHVMIADEALAANGLDVAECRRARRWPDVWAALLRFIGEEVQTNPGMVILSGYNIFGFDCKVLYSECLRYGLEVPSDWQYADLFAHVHGGHALSRSHAPKVFEDDLARHWAANPSMKPNHKLGTVYHAVFGRPLEDAHTALADATAVLDLWRAAVAKHADELMLYDDGRVRRGFAMQARPWHLFSFLACQGLSDTFTEGGRHADDVQPEQWPNLHKLTPDGRQSQSGPIKASMGLVGARRAACGPAMKAVPKASGDGHEAASAAPPAFPPGQGTAQGLEAEAGQGLAAGGPGIPQPAPPARDARSSIGAAGMLSQPCTALHQVSKAQQGQLAAAGVHTIGELLELFQEPSGSIKGTSSGLLAYLKSIGVSGIGDKRAAVIASQLQQLALELADDDHSRVHGPEGPQEYGHADGDHGRSIAAGGPSEPHVAGPVATTGAGPTVAEAGEARPSQAERLWLAGVATGRDSRDTAPTVPATTTNTTSASRVSRRDVGVQTTQGSPTARNGVTGATARDGVTGATARDGVTGATARDGVTGATGGPDKDGHAKAGQQEKAAATSEAAWVGRVSDGGAWAELMYMTGLAEASDSPRAEPGPRMATHGGRATPPTSAAASGALLAVVGAGRGVPAGRPERQISIRALHTSAVGVGSAPSAGGGAAVEVGRVSDGGAWAELMYTTGLAEASDDITPRSAAVAMTAAGRARTPPRAAVTSASGAGGSRGVGGSLGHEWRQAVPGGSPERLPVSAASAAGIVMVEPQPLPAGLAAPARRLDLDKHGRPLEADADVTALRGVATAGQAAMAKVGIRTVGQLQSHLLTALHGEVTELDYYVRTELHLAKLDPRYVAGIHEALMA